jgi:hypothetical protein
MEADRAENQAVPSVEAMTVGAMASMETTWGPAMSCLAEEIQIERSRKDGRITTNHQKSLNLYIIQVSKSSSTLIQSLASMASRMAWIRMKSRRLASSWRFTVLTTV